MTDQNISTGVGALGPLTQVLFHFVDPNGLPMANRFFEIQLAESNFLNEDGVLMPKTMYVQTDAEGKYLAKLRESKKPYYVLMEGDTPQDVISYSFYVPKVEGIVRAQDLFNVEPSCEVPIVEEAIDLLRQYKIEARQSAVEAKDSADAAKSYEIIVVGAASDAENSLSLSRDEAAKAKSYAEDSEASREATDLSKEAAKTSETNAKASETSANNSATDATAAKTAAEAARDIATTKANEASASAVLAEQHKLSAEGHKNQAGVFATNLSDSVNTSGAFSVDSLTASVRSMIHSIEAQEIINNEHTSSTQSSSSFRERLADKVSPIQGAALVGYEGKTVRSALQYLYLQLDTLFGSLKFTNLTAQESVTIPVMGSSFVNVTLNSPECLINFLLLPEYETTDALRELNLRLVQGTGVNRVVWGPNVLWSYGRAPTLSYEKDYFDMIKLITLDNGVTWIGSFEGGWFHEE